MTLSRAAASLSAPDYFLMYRVNRWRPPRWIRVWMLAASRAGDGWLWWGCGLAVLASNDAARYQAFAAAALPVLCAFFIFYFPHPTPHPPPTPPPPTHSL